MVGEGGVTGMYLDARIRRTSAVKTFYPYSQAHRKAIRLAPTTRWNGRQILHSGTNFGAVTQNEDMPF